MEIPGNEGRWNPPGKTPPPVAIRSTRSFAPVGCKIDPLPSPSPSPAPSSLSRPQAARSATAARAIAMMRVFMTGPPSRRGLPHSAAPRPSAVRALTTYGRRRVPRPRVPHASGYAPTDGHDARPAEDIGASRRRPGGHPGTRARRGRGPRPRPRGLDLRHRSPHLRLERVGAGPDPRPADDVRPRGGGVGRDGRTGGPSRRARRLRRGRDPHRVRDLLHLPYRPRPHLQEPSHPRRRHRRSLRRIRGRAGRERVDRGRGDRSRSRVGDGAVRERGACGVRDRGRRGPAHEPGSRDRLRSHRAVLRRHRQGARRVEVFAIEPNDERRALAGGMGADLLVDPTVEDPVEVVLRETDGNGAEVVLEMSGNARAIDQGTKMLARGGRMSLLGLPDAPVTLDLNDQVIFKEAKILGITGREMFRTWQQTTTLLSTGRVDISPVITHRFGLERYDEAFETAASGRAAKVIMFPGA